MTMVDTPPIIPVPTPTIVVPITPVPRASGVGWPGAGLAPGTDRRKLQLARDCLIDCEDALLQVLVHDPSLQPVIDEVVRILMDVSHRAEVAPSTPLAVHTLPLAPIQEG